MDDSRLLVELDQESDGRWIAEIVAAMRCRGGGNFTSIDDPRCKVLAFIAYFNATMAKPFKWTYQGKPLAA